MTAAANLRVILALSRRALNEILQDRYVQNRLDTQQQRRLLDRPEVVRALGDDAVEQTRRDLATLSQR